MRPLRVAITMGDPAGVGPEVLADGLNAIATQKGVYFVIAGNPRLLSKYGLEKSSHVEVLSPRYSGAPAFFKPGLPNASTGRAALEYLRLSLSWIKQGRACALVTGPISKADIIKSGFSFPGHTEFLAHAFDVRNAEMAFVSKRLRVVLVTRHISLKEAAAAITSERLEQCGSLSLDFLKKYFKIKNPRIAVCGLNPHAGEAGLFGKEEKLIIAPAVGKLNRNFGRYFFGPLSADSVFRQAYRGDFDLVMSMYHDQGLVPFKMTEFEAGAHLTLGLPFARTSPVHGTAFDIAGKGLAVCGSMTAAIKLAVRLAKLSFAETSNHASNSQAPQAFQPEFSG